MERAERWFMCRVGYVETWRAASLAAGPSAGRRFADEWTAVDAIDVNQRLAKEAAALALTHGLRGLDALHLAAALALPRDDLLFATWDRRLHAAANDAGLSAFPTHP